jgi:hypothetical protein
LVNVALFELLDEVVSVRVTVESFSWLTCADGLGLAIGAVAAGRLAIKSLRAALAIVASAPLLGAIFAVSRGLALRPARGRA